MGYRNLSDFVLIPIITFKRFYFVGGALAAAQVEIAAKAPPTEGIKPNSVRSGGLILWREEYSKA